LIYLCKDKNKESSPSTLGWAKGWIFTIQLQWFCWLYEIKRCFNSISNL